MPDLSSLWVPIDAPSAAINVNDIAKIAESITKPFSKLMVLGCIICIVYFAISEILFRGTTIGKRLFQIKTVMINDPCSGPSPFQTLMRSILKCAAAFYCMDINSIIICIICLANFFFGVISSTGSFGYDVISRTMVVRYDYGEHHPLEKVGFL
jgi:uncharacterized RDD family membrane protein YckC